ncbi:unnamed protein product, partial [Caenorhabditis auriculariae]
NGELMVEFKPMKFSRINRHKMFKLRKIRRPAGPEYDTKL